MDKLIDKLQMALGEIRHQGKEPIEIRINPYCLEILSAQARDNGMFTASIDMSRKFQGIPVIPDTKLDKEKDFEIHFKTV